MKKRISLILVLMTLCVGGITGLQLYWNYQNYRSTVKNFNHDINEALNTAVDREIDQRHQQIAARFKKWLADTSFISITCDNQNRHHETVFNMKDAHPVMGNEKWVSIHIKDFNEPLKVITPRAKKIFIDHFGDVILRGDLKKGVLYFYTPRLGDSLTVLFNNSKCNKKVLYKCYQQELLLKGINAAFKLDPAPRQHFFLTQKINTAMRRPYEKEFVYAGFPSPDTYYFKEMKWLIITSLLLIGITIACFGYTIKTLFSQHKLALLKDDFINNMTHEFNTPLSSIKITAEALKTFDHDKKNQQEYLDIISYQAEKLTALSARILDAGKERSGAAVTTIALGGLIETAIHDMDPQRKAANATIHFDAPEEDIYINGEAAAMLNVFINIIDNALKYSGPAVLNITLRKDNRYAILKFADNGIGISPAYYSKIFDKFFRVPKGNIHDIKGYGLGLSYVKQVINQHNGLITVAENRPSGSIFTVKLPLK